jgi:RNA polymerase sigma-70 factor (ECF subfamily)
MDDTRWLADQFEHHRSHLRDVALRMLGSAGDADDAVQEAWIRLSRTDTADVANLAGWLTTVTARVCLDMLRARKRRQAAAAEHAAAPAEPGTPARDVAIADAVGAALVVVLDTLAPAERVAFVLHDLFDLPFDEIARIVDRSEAATRQLASRARRRLQRKDAPPPDGQATRAVVDAFLAAARNGDYGGLLAVLDPEVVVRADELAVRTAATSGWADLRDTRGAGAVANLFTGRARGALRATVDGEPGAAWVVHGQVRSVFVFTIAGDRVAAVDVIMDPDALAEIDIALVT